MNTKLLGITYYDPKEQKELIGNFNVRVLDPTYQTISKVDVYKRQLYNRARQAAITQEITEVIAGAKSQKKKRK